MIARPSVSAFTECHASAGTIAPTLTQALNLNNQISRYQYDANGNQTQDPARNAFSYDIENRLTSAPGASYAYNPAHHRGWRYTSSSATYQIVFHGGSPTGQNPVYATVTCVDTQVLSPAIAATPTDNIASVRADLSVQFGQTTPSTFFPWGEEQTSTPNDRVKFATYRRDSESNLDYAWNRYYNNATARFMSPDPYAASANPQNPQSWNRYAYTLNDPIGANDPTGPDDAACDDGCSDAPYGDSGSTGGDGGTGGSSPTANYTSADLTSTQCYDPNTAAPAPCSSSSTGPMQTVGDPSTSNTISVTTSPTTPSANVGSPVTQTVLLTQGYPGILIWSPSGSPVGSDGGPPNGYQIGSAIGSHTPTPQTTLTACLTGELINNFIGGDDRTAVTLLVHIGAVIAKQGAGTLLPGPGWIYTGTAIVWDAAMIGRSYLTCKPNSGGQ